MLFNLGKKYVCSFLGMIILVVSNNATAFNCQKAASSVEHFICADQRLLQADQKLNTLFKSVFHNLNPAEKKELLYEERDFLASRANCLTENSPNSKTECLTNLYKSRQTQLSTWPNDLSQSLSFTNANQTLLINLFYNRFNQRYLAKYQLVDMNNISLNNGQFKGCTYGGIIMNISDYLKKRNFLNISPLKNGFAIHFMEGCGAQSIWKLNIVTSSCVAALPATDDKGQYIKIGKDPQKIQFGYLQGFGANRRVTNDYLLINDQGLLQLSETQPTFKNETRISCKAI